jgi:hypothetical protein
MSNARQAAEASQEAWFAADATQQLPTPPLMLALSGTRNREQQARERAHHVIGRGKSWASNTRQRTVPYQVFSQKHWNCRGGRKQAGRSNESHTTGRFCRLYSTAGYSKLFGFWRRQCPGKPSQAYAAVTCEGRAAPASVSGANHTLEYTPHSSQALQQDRHAANQAVAPQAGPAVRDEPWVG